jgi:hypothetical protein
MKLISTLLYVKTRFENAPEIERNEMQILNGQFGENWPFAITMIFIYLEV